MRALLFERRLPRFAAAAAISAVSPTLAAHIGPLRLADVDLPELTGPGWQHVKPRLSGICGSDLSTLTGTASRYFEPMVSFPFVLGHEIAGELADGTRVVIEPVLGCATRGVVPPCPPCARGDLGNCERVAFGDLEPGLQTGFCADTGGGWAVALAAHESQLHQVPDGMSDEDAVMVEPTACAIHCALAADAGADDVVAVIGAGSLGLLTIAALAHFTPPAQLLAAAKHPTQRKWADELGASQVVAPGELLRAVRRTTGSLALGSGSSMRLTGGADVVIDCVGSAASLGQSLDLVRPRGRVVVAGMPGVTSMDLTGLWHREIQLVGAYTYGVEARAGNRRTFDLAFELVRSARLGRLVSATYPLDRFEEAIAHAAAAGPRGAVKIAFDLRDERERNRI